MNTTTKFYLSLLERKKSYENSIAECEEAMQSNVDETRRFFFYESLKYKSKLDVVKKIIKDYELA